MEKKIHPSKGFQYYHDDPSFSELSMQPPPSQPPQAQAPLQPLPKFSSDPPPSQPLKSSSETSMQPPLLDNDKSVQQPSGTYVIHFPKEQILSYPPPENSAKYESLSRRKPKRSCCCRFFCYSILFLFILGVIAAIAAGIFYLTCKPVAPKYEVSNVSIRGLNLTSPVPLSPVFDISIRADNSNKKLGIYYLSGSEVEVSYDDVTLGNGVIPEFYQPTKNVTIFQTSLKESGLVLAGNVMSAMKKGLSQKNVPLRVNVKAPVKIKAGSVKTWTIRVKVQCDVIVDSLNENSNILSKSCDYKVNIW